MKMNISWFFCLGATLCCLTGCGSAEEQTGAAGQEEPVLKDNKITYQLLEEAELNYDVPEMIPGLCVPSGGYDVAEDKLAHLYGKILPEEFELLEKESGAVVYRGTFTDAAYHKDTGEYTAVADFSEFAKVGEYILRCDYLGYSYPFSMEEKLQENALNEMVAEFPELLAKSEDIRSNVDGALLLLLSYDFYSEVYEGEEGEVPKVLDVVRKYVDVLAEDVQAEEPAMEYDPYMISALLAKYGHIYQVFDWNRGNDAIKLAKKLWKNAEAGEGLDSEYRILASAELYRATGTYSYRKLVQEHFLAQMEEEKVLESHYEVLAALTHFKTDYKVKRSLCTDLMNEILDRAEEVASYMDLDNQLLGSNSREEKLAEIMWNMVYVSVVEYVITNYEYGDLLENEYFYLQGRNPDAYDYVNELIAENPRLQASYVMMLCEHLAHDHLE